MAQLAENSKCVIKCLNHVHLFILIGLFCDKKLSVIFLRLFVLVSDFSFKLLSLAANAADTNGISGYCEKLIFSSTTGTFSCTKVWNSGDELPLILSVRLSKVVLLLGKILKIFGRGIIALFSRVREVDPLLVLVPPR